MMARVEELRELMKENSLQGFLVISPYNLHYLANLTGVTGLTMITLGKAFLVTDFHYTEQVAEQAIGFTIVKDTGHIFDEVADLAERLQLDNLTFEEAQVSFANYSLLEEILPCELVPVMGLIEELREMKDEEEVAIIEKAHAITNQGFTFALEMIKPGMTETEVANQLDLFIRSKRASGVFFETTVASGLYSAMPYNIVSHKVIEKGELITSDFGCYYESYVSDIIYTFTIGNIQSKSREIYDIALEARPKVSAEAKPGLMGIQLDAIARDYIASYGYSDAFGHSTGHGIGLEIHEGPNVSFRAGKQFVPGNMIADEPGTYSPGIGGARIGDDLLVTTEGNRVLTHAPEELVIL